MKKSKFIFIYFISLLAIILSPTLAKATPLSTDERVTITTKLSPKTVVPGTKCTITVLFTITPGDHIYGPIPGDTGLPTKVAWELPQGLNITDTRWSPSQEIEKDGLKYTIYEGEAKLETDILIPSDQTSNSELNIVGNASWLICNDSCIPGKSKFLVKVPIKEAMPSSEQNSPTVAKAQNDLGLGIACLLALFGGILLNLMPCVFPVLSLKLMELINSSQEEKNIRKAQAFSYSFGIIVSFWLVAGTLIALRATGQSIGWGFQMQSPYFVVILSYLFLAMSLNMFGIFEIGLGLTRLGNAGSKSKNSFFSGMVATVAATPCTAPFMGTSIGYALTLPWWQALTIFTILGLGMALPLVLLTVWPSWQRLLPKPGAWMVTLRQLLAFPLLLASVYFVFIVDSQAGPYVTAAVLSGEVTLGFAAWIYGRWGQYGNKWAIFGAIISLVFALVLGWGSYRYQTNRTIDTGNKFSQAPTSKNLSEDIFQSWTPEAVDEALSANRPVFIDFGASWCLTCQINENTVLSSSEICELFKNKNISAFKADWTDRDERITKALERYGRTGVPLYIYYDGTSMEPKILPEILTKNIVIEAITGAKQ